MDEPGPPSEPVAPASEPRRRRLPGPDRLTTSQRVRLRTNRVRGRLSCLFGRHTWARQSNPEVGGPQAVYHLCRRCGTEYSPPDPTQTWM